MGILSKKLAEHNVLYIVKISKKNFQTAISNNFLPIWLYDLLNGWKAAIRTWIKKTKDTKEMTT